MKKTKLGALIKLNNLEKQNRRNRLEEKLRQQEYSGDMEDLFDTLTKILNTNSEASQTLQNQTLESLAYNTIVLKALDPQQQSNSLDDRAVTLKDDRGKTFFVDTDMIAILIEMVKQTNNQFQLISVDANSNKFKLNGVVVSLVPDGIKMKGNVYDFSKGFAILITNRDLTERDIKGDEDKIKQFLRDIAYKQKGDTKSNRSKLIKRILSSIGEGISRIGEPTSHVISISTSSEEYLYNRDTSDYEQGVKEEELEKEEEEEEEEEETEYETDKQIEASGLTKTEPNNQRSCHLNGLVERLEVLILKTKAGHDGLYDEMLDLSRQLFSMNFINQEQLDNFVFNYGK